MGPERHLHQPGVPEPFLLAPPLPGLSWAGIIWPQGEQRGSSSRAMSALDKEGFGGLTVRLQLTGGPQAAIWRACPNFRRIRGSRVRVAALRADAKGHFWPKLSGRRGWC